MVTCYYCGRKFRSKKAVYAHLQYCAERKRMRDQWIRYPINSPKLVGCIGVISRSPKSLKLVDAAHARLVSGTITAEGFAGYVQALSDVGLVEFMVERSPPLPEQEGVLS